jgi:hypothetical protein
MTGAEAGTDAEELPEVLLVKTKPIVATRPAIVSQ